MFIEDIYLMGMTIRGILCRCGASSFSLATVEFTNRVLGASLKDQGEERSDVPTRRIEVLRTDHEQEVLEHLARALSNKQIVKRIERTEHTVDRPFSGDLCRRLSD